MRAFYYGIPLVVVAITVPEVEEWPCEIISEVGEVGHAVHPSPANVIKENNQP